LVYRNVKCIRLALGRLEGRSDILRPLDHQWRDVEAEHARRSLGLAHLQHGLGIADIKDDAQAA
jgi:hypothetical protein